MSRPGRGQGELKGRTAEANALAVFLRDLTAADTVSQLAERYNLSRSVWSQYRSGQKVIPLPRLTRIVEDRFARDARTREQKLQEARRLCLAAMAAAATATPPLGTAPAPTPTAKPVPVPGGPSASPDQTSEPGTASEAAVAEAIPATPGAKAGTGSGQEPAADIPLPGRAAGLSADNPLTSADARPAPAGDELLIVPPPRSAGATPGRRAGRYSRWRTPAQWAALAVLVAALIIANRSNQAKDPSAEASSPQNLGQQSIEPGQAPSLTASPNSATGPGATPEPSLDATSPTPAKPSTKPSASASPTPKPTKSKAPQPAPPLPALGAGPRTFVNAATNMCLEIRRSAGEDGATANQWTCNNSSSQKWLITHPTGQTNIVSMDSRKCLEIRGDVGDDGATANQWSCNNVPSSQVWRFQPATSGGWQIVGAYSGKCLTIRGQGDGALASQWPCDNSPSQTWH
ncbi:RICIN domain-containing protein [Streptomyces sp. Isolate_45]|uniref:RICIN domain-containing protein n=1 Tax=Streptomyces sp. Isolate_45 TaxID=2950111 RepID=UPI002481A305|nr:RICIN domain-containing protein [Streptomyces sp. Isolate_45]MDA5283691.1 RICIN domain-containing protein [Streptomyces sp. Isolate_45]